MRISDWSSDVCSSDLRARRDDGQVELAVRDNGIGIAPEMLPQVFGLFVQAPQPSARTRGGLGLGLTLVKSQVEMHGGTVADRKSAVKGKSLSVRVDLGGWRILKKKKKPSKPTE